MKLSTFSIEF